jgi:hypothetical protein
MFNFFQKSADHNVGSAANVEARELAMSQVEVGDLPSALQERMNTPLASEEIRTAYTQINTNLLSIA